MHLKSLTLMCTAIIVICGFLFLSGIGQIAQTEDPSIADLGFTPSGWMGDWNDIEFNEKPREEPGSVKITYTPRGKNGWAGMYWLYPSSNWGDLPGKDLKGYHELTFRAKGAEGGESKS
jgi:hypothetical protein